MDWESKSHGNNKFHCHKWQVDTREPVGCSPLYMILNDKLYLFLAVSTDRRRAGGGGGGGTRGLCSWAAILIYGVLPPNLGVLLTSTLACLAPEDSPS
jgi:hypothetical protein